MSRSHPGRPHSPGWRSVALAGALLLLARPTMAQRADGAAARLHDAVAAAFAGDTAASGMMLRISSPRHNLVWQTVLGRYGAPNDTAAAIRRPYRIASITKTYTAMAVYRLMELGKLTLADPIATHLSPETAAMLTRGRYDPAHITIDHLLHHTSGLTDHSVGSSYLAQIEANPSHRWTRAEQVALAMTQAGPLNAPGAEWHYSDTGYLLLGEIIERLSGEPLPAAIRRLGGFERLGITETWFESLEPAPHGTPEKAAQFFQGLLATSIDASVDLYGGGGILTTMEDQDRYLRALVDGQVFRKPSTLRDILAEKPEATSSPLLQHRGLFFSERQGTHECFSHTGFWGSIAVYCPDAGVAVIGTTNKSSVRRLLRVVTMAVTMLDSIPPAATVVRSPGTAPKWCDPLPRDGNAMLERIAITDPWFDVRRVEPGVYAIGEPRQFQEAIAWLIVGTRRALLFDTGIGMRPIRPVITQLTSLPVTVINSHTHFDHTGGNAEFADVRAMAGAYTRGNMRGIPHRFLASEASRDAFCGAVPSSIDTAAFRARPWRATAQVRDGMTFDLGGRTIEVLGVPGHTPDALALLDRAGGLLWTGDSFYEGPVWLYVAETDLDAYQRSIDRLAALLPSVRRLLPAHNLAIASPSRLPKVQQAMRAIRAGRVTGVVAEKDQRVFTVDDLSFLISTAALARSSRNAPQGNTGRPIP